MTQRRLLPCPGCSRHAHASELACPFCGSPLTEAFAAAPLPRKPTARVSRAALYAIGATALAAPSLTLAAACGTSGGGEVDSGSDQLSHTLYGLPCMGVDGGPCGVTPDTGPGAEAGSDGPGQGDGGDAPIAVYGAPPDGFGGEGSSESGSPDGHTG